MVGTNSVLPRNPDALQNVYISPDFLVKAYEYEEFVELSRGDWERVKLLLRRPVLDLKGSTVQYEKREQTLSKLYEASGLEDFERGEGT